MRRDDPAVSLVGYKMSIILCKHFAVQLHIAHDLCIVCCTTRIFF